jgi:dTDP-4-amino-4,6-dideoxygalactose transaminase
LCISYADKSLALEAALICLRHNEGLGRRQLIMPSYGPAELPRLAIKQGWEPVFCDIDEETLCLAPRSVESVLSRDVAAIAIVHAHGNPADMETIKAIATRHNLQLLSYLGKGLGARSGGNAIGSLGEICVLDFAAPAPIGVGEGAAVTVPAKALPCLMARYGPGEELVSGLSETLDVPASIKAIPAAFIEASLRHVADWIDQRQMLADRYATVLRCLPNVSLQRPESVHSRHAYADLAVICHTAEAANRLIDRLRAYRVECESGFPCLHRLPEYSTGQGRIPAVAERLADRVVLMPLYVGIRPAVTELVTSALCEAMQ